MFIVSDTLQIPEVELLWSYARSGGPGGQNVNKVASKAVLHWPVIQSPSVPQEIKDRFCAQQRTRINLEGELVLSSERFRDQEKNRLDCLEKLRAMLLQAAVRPKKRKVTRPSRASKLRRLDSKRRQSARKSARRAPGPE